MSILLNALGAGTGVAFKPALSSGSLANLAISGTCTLVFDLADQFPGDQSWREMVSVLLAISGGTDSTGSSIKAYWSDDGTATDQVPAAPCYNVAGGGVNYTGGLSNFVMQLMVMKRYLRVVITNGSNNAQGANAKLHAAFLNV